MKLGTRQITLYAVLISVALIISYFENLIPAAFIPVPGVKPGLSNIITLFALYFQGLIPALIIIFCRCALASMFGGGLTSFIFSLFGGVSAVFVMHALKRLDGKSLSIYGVSIAGAAAHGIGQIIAAMLLLQSTSVFYYSPFLLFSSVITGFLTAYISDFLFKRLY